MRKNLKGLRRCARCLRPAQAEVVYVADPAHGPVTRKLCAVHLATIDRLSTPVQVRHLTRSASGRGDGPSSRISF